MSLTATARFTPRGDLGRFIDVKVTPAVRASVEAAGALIMQAAQRYCPVDTGALRDSITVEMAETDKTVTAVVSPHMPYASYVEYGTGVKGDSAVPHTDKPGMKPQPYMRPALDENRGAIADLFRSNLSVAINT